MKTRDEVEDLKRQWRKDPCWDIEDTEGFEEYREELRAYADATSAAWEAAETKRQTERMVELGIPGNGALLAYIERLERRIKDLEDRVEFIGERVGV